MRKLYQDKNHVFSHCFATETVNVVKKIGN